MKLKSIVIEALKVSHSLDEDVQDHRDTKPTPAYFVVCPPRSSLVLLKQKAGENIKKTLCIVLSFWSCYKLRNDRRTEFPEEGKVFDYKWWCVYYNCTGIVSVVYVWIGGQFQRKSKTIVSEKKIIFRGMSACPRNKRWSTCPRYKATAWAPRWRKWVQRGQGLQIFTSTAVAFLGWLA